MEDIQIQSQKVIDKQAQKIAEMTHESIMSQVVVETLQETIAELRGEVAQLKEKLELPQEG